MQPPMMKLFAALATGLCAVAAAWQGAAGWWRGVVLVFKRSGSDSYVALADNPAAFWFCVFGWFAVCGVFVYLCRRYWREFDAA